MRINKILKIMFIISAIVFLVTFISVAKNNCEACEIEYEGRTINGVEAFQIFEHGCISYARPWSSQPETNINITVGVNGS